MYIIYMCVYLHSQQGSPGTAITAPCVPWPSQTRNKDLRACLKIYVQSMIVTDCQCLMEKI